MQHKSALCNGFIAGASKDSTNDEPGDYQLLPTHVILHTLELLPPNDIAANGRRSCKEAACYFATPAQRTVRISQPLSAAAAAAWREAAAAAAALPSAAATATAAKAIPGDGDGSTGSLRHLSRAGKQLALCAAASSGSQTNLELAWGLLQPCIFPGLPPAAYYLRDQGQGTCSNAFNTDPGVAAAQSGHVHLLPWLLSRGLVLRPGKALAAAARHSDLTALQGAWGLLAPALETLDDTQHQATAASGGIESRGLDAIDWAIVQASYRLGSWRAGVLTGAVGSSTPDALDKVNWLCAAGGCDSKWLQQEEVIRAAVMSGNPGRVRRLHACGWLGQASLAHVFPLSLRHDKSLDLAQWLVAEGGFSLVSHMGGEQFQVSVAVAAAAVACDGVGRLRWLKRQGMYDVPWSALWSAARNGRLETVRFLHEEEGLQLHPSMFADAAFSGHVPTAAYLLKRGCPMSPDAIRSAPLDGDLSMLRWLLHEAKCPWDARNPPDMLRRLLAAMCPGPSSVSKGTGTAASEQGGSSALAAVRLLLQAGVLTAGMHASSALMDHVLSYGRTDVARVLLDEGGFSLPPMALKYAVESGCEGLLEWLVVQRGCQAPPYCPVYVYAAKAGDLATLECLKRLGVPVCDGTLRAAVIEGCPVVILQWLVERGGAGGTEQDVRAALKAAEGRVGMSRGPVSGVEREEPERVVEWLRGLVAAGHAG